MRLAYASVLLLVVASAGITLAGRTDPPAPARCVHRGSLARERPRTVDYDQALININQQFEDLRSAEDQEAAS